jgi:dihydrodipicolinate synthase/N-acetylneuraminate lyase
MVKLLAGHERIVGLKDSSGNGTYFSTVSTLMQAYPSFSLFVGPDEMMAPLVLNGAHGGVSAGANLFPKLYVDLYNAAVSRNFDVMSSLQKKVMEISVKIYNPFPVAVGFLKGIKTALSVMGICSDRMEFPLGALDERQKETIKKNLSELQL